MFFGLLLCFLTPFFTTTEQEVAKLANVNVMSTETLEADEDYVDSHYTRPHWARATTEPPI